MPDPAWTNQYSMNQSPEGNGFSRTLYGTPVITEVTGGSPANRRVEINSNNGSVVFITSQVPSLNDDTGATVEMIVDVSGAGNAGFELTFLNRYIGVQIYTNRITIQAGNGLQEAATPSNASNVTIRLIYAAGQCSIYRNGSLVGTYAVAVNANSFQRVLWWGEEGGTQIFRALRYWVGGAMAPG